MNWTVCLVAVRLCTAGGLWTELWVWLQWGYILVEYCELNCVSVCSEVIYCWRAVNCTVCLVAVRLCSAGGLWTELCVSLRWEYVLLADCELNCVCDCGEVEMNLPRETRYWWQVRGINFALNYLQILILKFDYSYYIDILLFLIVSQSHYKVCYYSGFKRIFYRMVINDNFRFHNN